MRWSVTFPAEIAIHFESYGDEDSAYALAVEKVRESLSTLEGVDAKVKWRAGSVKGTPEPDPRD